MIGNESYEECVKYFTEMFEHLENAGQNWDLSTMLNAIKHKIILDQKRKNIKNVYNTPMVTNFEIWFDCVNSTGENLHEEPGEEDENDNNDEVQNAFEDFCTSSEPPSSFERLLRCGSPPPPTEIPDGY